MVKVSVNLKSLSHIFHNADTPLYLVGGYIRNYLLNISTYDVDIAGAMPAGQVITLCKKNGFKAEVINKKLGTVLISKKDEKYEYTTFRKEIYDQTGKHRPQEVEFVSSPTEDAVRRDFTINAMYYDIYDEKLYDFFDSQTDLKNKVLKTVTKPSTVFNDDGLRILRLIRFICELGFKPERQTLKTAQNLNYKLGDISKERILREIKVTINGGLKYLLKNQTHGNAIKYYNSLKLWPYIFNENFKDFKVKRSGGFYKAFLKSDGQNRYIAFMCLVLSNYVSFKTNDNNIFYSVQQLLGQNGLRDSSKNIDDVYEAFIFAKKLLTYNDIEITDNKLCLHFDKLSFEIKNYLALVNSDKINKVRMCIMKLKKAKIPFTEDELKITNSDLINKVRVEDMHISQVKKTLFIACVEGLIVNDKEILIEQAQYIYDNYLKKSYSQSRKELEVEEKVVYTDAMKTGDFEKNEKIAVDMRVDEGEKEDVIIKATSSDDIKKSTAIKNKADSAKSAGGIKKTAASQCEKKDGVEKSSSAKKITTGKGASTSKPKSNVNKNSKAVGASENKTTSKVSASKKPITKADVAEKSITKADVVEKSTAKVSATSKSAGISSANKKSSKSKAVSGGRVCGAVAKGVNSTKAKSVANKPANSKKAEAKVDKPTDTNA